MDTSISRNVKISKYFGLKFNKNINYQISPDSLIQCTLLKKQGELSDTGALVVKTGKFTGRSPKDKFIVKDALTKNTVDWNEYNQEINEDCFDKLHQRMLLSLKTKELWIRDAIAIADESQSIRIRVVNDTPWSNLFVHNMFLRPTDEQLEGFEPDWQIIQIISFTGVPELEGIRSENFCIINFSKKIILIGGSGYTGEIKKSIFTVLNFLLPFERNILSMHCSANVGRDGDTALFFGLSGTGKTTLSTDLDRQLIGDDEHGWSDDKIFNLEGGCYAKCINLDKTKEPQIYSAIRKGSLVENVNFQKNSKIIDFESSEITENTRVSYPIDFVPNVIIPSIGGIPKNIFFLTCDAYGVLPPISKLSPDQALYQFLSGYTAKIAGTETGITIPVSTFSTCFGAPFLPLNPVRYAELLEKKILESKANVWLINTGWTGGGLGVGERISLRDTRAIINSILSNKLDDVEWKNHEVFDLSVPKSCPGVSSDILDPKFTWVDEDNYMIQARGLAQKFTENFKKFELTKFK